jgi:hypothetical protein
MKWRRTMGKIVVTKKCGAPTLKQLPLELGEQISVDGVDATSFVNVLAASLPQLAKNASSNNYNRSEAVRSINLASSMYESVKNAAEDWNNYHATRITNELQNLGINIKWQVQHENGFIESMDASELYSASVVDIHIVVKRKLKDKKFLATKGVK